MSKALDHLEAFPAEQAPQPPQPCCQQTYLLDQPDPFSKGLQVMQRELHHLLPGGVQTISIIEEDHSDPVTVAVKPASLFKQNLLRTAHSQLGSEQKDGEFFLGVSPREVSHGTGIFTFREFRSSQEQGQLASARFGRTLWSRFG